MHGYLGGCGMLLTIYNFLGRADVSEPVMQWCNKATQTEELETLQKHHDGLLILFKLRSIGAEW